MPALSDEQRRAALAEFLRGRRARLTPADVGLPPTGRRRTPGLRREEVAQLANVGTAWYTAIEQGRDVHPARQVLDSVAAALRLSHDERRHLFLLADQPRVDAPTLPGETVCPALRRIVDALDPIPAYVMGRRWDFLIWNDAADRLLDLTASEGTFTRNAVWRLFLDPRARTFYIDWQAVAMGVLAQFRADSARYLGDPAFQELIDGLTRESVEFAAWWPRHDVLGAIDVRKEIGHPTRGRLAFEHLTLQMASNPDLRLMVYTPCETA